MTASTNQPSVGADDQYYLPGPVAKGTETMVLNGDTDALTYIAHDRTSKGQTFTTGSNPLGYTISSVTARHILLTSGTTYGNFANGASLNFRFGTISGTTLTPIVTTTATYSGPTLSDGGDLGTGNYFTFDLSSAGIGTLTPNTTYFFELAPTVNPQYFELHNTTNNATSYTRGTAFHGEDTAALDSDLSVTLSSGEFAFVAKLNPIGAPAVAVTVNPVSAMRQQSFTVTATTTPVEGGGTVTNATVDLSAIGGPAAANLVLSTDNVFTNTFTVPLAAPMGVASLPVTVLDTTPLHGVGSATFTVVPRAPTNAIVVRPISGTTSVYEYTEASFHFAATNDAPLDASFPMAYAWYKGGQLVSTNPMGPNYTFLTMPADNNKEIYAIASVADTNYSSITVTSAVVTLTVNPGAVVITNGLKRELFANVSRQQVEIGDTAAAGQVDMVSAADIGLVNFNDTVNYVERLSGYFIPPADGAYVFFINSDDDSDLFLSTDSNPTNKVLIAQEKDWSNPDQWLSANGTGYGNSAANKRSDQFSVDGVTTNYPNGINLVGGQAYYIEAVHHQGGGGGDLGVTYDLTNDLYSTTYDSGTDTYTNSSTFTNGAVSLLNATNKNIALLTMPGTNIIWSLQPQASVTIYEGLNTNFSAIAASDAEMAFNYQWFIVTNGGAFPGTPLTSLMLNGTNTALTLISASYNGAQIYCVASTEEGGLSITSSVCNLTVIQAVFETGWVSEKKWMDVFMFSWVGGIHNSSYENGTDGNTNLFTYARPGFEAGLDNPSADAGGRRYSILQQVGYFVPPTNGNYVFFFTSHDDGDLFLSTDNTPVNKRRIAAEQNWSSNWQWNGSDGGSSVSQKRSDEFSPDGGVTKPYASGIPLVAGQRYYMEVWHQTHYWGNEQEGVYYAVMDGSGSVTGPANGDYPNCTGTNVGTSVLRCHNVTITQQPAPASLACVDGGSTHFSVAGTSDSQYPVCSAYGYTVTAPTSTMVYQWYKVLNGVTNAIDGATTSSLTAGPLTTADTGAKFYCAVRALGYTDDALHPIWVNSQTVSVTVAARSPSLLGHWVSGAASLADSANYVAPGVYDGGAVGGGSYSFTSDVPPGAPSGAQSLHLAGAGIVISNTATSDAGYAVNTFDGNIQNQFTIAFWAKGWPDTWNPIVSKNGDANNRGWQVRNDGSDSRGFAAFTMRGTGSGDTCILGNIGDWALPDDMASRTIACNDGNWHYYAGTYDVSTGIRSLYIDGQLTAQETGNAAYNLATPEHIMLGGRDTGSYGNYFTGSLYDVRIYNYALPQSQIAIIGNSKPTFTSQINADGNGNQQLVITYPFGTLLEATNLAGPWTTNSTVSPATINIDPTAPQVFFKLSNP
jgi:hypothetical protein